MSVAENQGEYSSFRVSRCISNENEYGAESGLSTQRVLLGAAYLSRYSHCARFFAHVRLRDQVAEASARSTIAPISGDTASSRVAPPRRGRFIVGS